MDFYLLPEKDAVQFLKSDAEHGLREKEARRRLGECGKNIVRVERKNSPFQIFLEQFKSPLVAMLLVAAAISFLFGENMLDSLLILTIVIINAIFGFIQNYKAERSMEALKKMSVKKALVMRDGVLRRLDTSLIVPGDIVYLEAGEKVPADIRLLKTEGMMVDESILTGESQAVAKNTERKNKPCSISDRSNMVFMDTLITKGSGYGIVVATGKATEIGSIAKMISSREEKTAFEKELQRLGKRIGWIILVLIGIIATVQLMFNLSSWDVILLTAISLGVAAIPEGLPAVVTLSMAIGTNRMLKKNVLVRKLTVIEGLGNADVICTDKTGTITENKMKVTKLWFNRMFIDVHGSSFVSGKRYIDTETVKPLIEIGMRCNTIKESINGFIGDPTEKALVELGSRCGFKLKECKVIEPFSSQTKIMISRCGKLFMKGATEKVLQRCSLFYDKGKLKKLDKKTKQEILKASRIMGSSALRVIAFARREDKEFVFTGLQGMMDLPRKGVKEAVKACIDAGISIKMITGDNIETAKAVARLIGLKGRALLGSEIEDLEHDELRKVVERTSIFARVVPKHKVMILRALKDNNHNVVMTGDGVNDAPALKKADVGISVMHGSDMAKSVSDMILLDDNFVSIKEAVKEGRTIFLNIRKFVNYLLSSNIGEVLTVFFVSLFGYIPLTAVQLLWINLLTDGFPALALGSDPSPKNIMKEKPFKKGIITKNVLKNIVSSGIVIGILATILFFIGKPNIKGTTLVFSGLVAYEILRIMMVRKGEKFFSNKMLLLAVGFSLLLQLLIIYTPLNTLFGVVPLTLLDWGYIAGLGVIGYIVMVNIRS